ncbi:MAG: cupin domain-containing protein [Reinekea sp.]
MRVCAVPHSKNPFSNLDFLENHWQQSPLLLRNAIHLPDLIDGDELAGLSLEPNVESRLIRYDPEQQSWHLDHGPFSEDQFANLPESNWTLLVQAVDHWVPEVRQVLERFDFLPRWRIDDIMISFATDQGGVGPHFDQYDVFLIQLSGQRQWKTGQLCDDDAELVNGLPVKMLTNFDTQDTWLLEPGDVLYLPPAIAHWGTSIGNSMTLSVGFRAPSDSEIVSEFGHFLSSEISDFRRYTDSKIENRAGNAHEIRQSDLERLKQRLHQYLDDDQLLAQWFGQYMTEPKYDDSGVDTGDWSFEAFKQHWRHYPLYRNSSSRMAYHGKTLFVDGQMLEPCVDKSELDRICSYEVLEYNGFTDTSGNALQLIWTLLNCGALFFED